MSTLTLDALRADGERLTEEVSRESFLAHAGFQAEARLEPIYARYAHVTGRDSLDLALDLFRGAAEGTDASRSALSLIHISEPTRPY